MGEFALHVLGSPAVLRRDQQLRFPTRKTLALLIFLAVEGQAIPRERLVALLFPDSDSERGRAALRKTLLRLRNVLGDSGGIVTEGDALSLPPHWQLDLQTVEALEQAVLQRDKTAIAAILQFSEPRWGVFLDGFSLPDSLEFDDWATIQREHWYQRIDLLFAALSEFQQSYGDLHAAIQTSMRWTAFNPVSEAACRRLIDLHLANENSSMAKYTYHVYRQNVAAQLGVDPDPDLLSIIEQAETAPNFQVKLKRVSDQTMAEIAALLADKVKFINPTGAYYGKDRVLRHLEQFISDGLINEPFNFVVEREGALSIITYHYVMRQHDSVLDRGDDGLTIVSDDGLVVFDGTVRTRIERLASSENESNRTAIDANTAINVVVRLWELLRAAALRYNA